MKVAVPKEIVRNEKRVALVPDTIAKLAQSDIEIVVESGAGDAASFFDNEYEEAGATVVADIDSLYQGAEIVLKVQPPVFNDAVDRHEVEVLDEGSVLIAFLQPLTNLKLVKMLVDKSITSFSMEMIPRVARAQKMDALTSMSSISGYKATLIASNLLGKYLPMMMTAAGTLAPAKGLVLGAGVAGLQAIATSRRLGAVVEAFDVRPAVKEQVESLGATFIETEKGDEDTEDTGGYAKELSKDSQNRDRRLIHRHASASDFIITTALIPGRPAPVLITEDMVSGMKPGSVIVDIAAEMGGNCELTEPGEKVVKHGVVIYGPLNLPSSVPVHASQTYSRNISSLLLHLIKENKVHVDFEDIISQGSCITHQGKIVHEPTKALLID